MKRTLVDGAHTLMKTGLVTDSDNGLLPEDAAAEMFTHLGQGGPGSETASTEAPRWVAVSRGTWDAEGAAKVGVWLWPGQRTRVLGKGQPW